MNIENLNLYHQMVPGLENDEMPHETGKFGRIFKNPEPIGEGSFGKVYKVVHKLDGKIYAVKKVRLNLGKSEELQQKKVFREVFAMTDLHHPNIVRYSTCWVEIEKIEEKKPRITNNTQQIEKTQLEPEEITEEQESEATSSVQEHTNPSSAGFAWDISGEKEESKTGNSRQMGDNKINDKVTAKKKDVDVQSQSLAKTFNEESLNENSSISQLSRTTSEAIRGFRIYLYIQMEYCSGQSLRNYLDSSQNKHSSKQSLMMFKKILEGVDAIHERGILHRDLKPANIFLADNDNVKIGDFGLASLDNTEEDKENNDVRLRDKKLEKSLSKGIGTPMYASPEQERSGRYNFKTDIYSLGLIFCEMVAGITTGHERYQLFTSVRSNQDLPVYFKEKYPKESEIILKMTAFSPEERPTAKEVLAIIDKLWFNRKIDLQSSSEMEKLTELRALVANQRKMIIHLAKVNAELVQANQKYQAAHQKHIQLCKSKLEDLQKVQTEKMNEYEGKMHSLKTWLEAKINEVKVEDHKATNYKYLLTKVQMISLLKQQNDKLQSLIAGNNAALRNFRLENTLKEVVVERKKVTEGIKQTSSRGIKTPSQNNDKAKDLSYLVRDTYPSHRQRSKIFSSNVGSTPRLILNPGHSEGPGGEISLIKITSGSLYHIYLLSNFYNPINKQGKLHSIVHLYKPRYFRGNISQPSCFTHNISELLNNLFKIFLKFKLSPRNIIHSEHALIKLLDKE